MNAEVGRGGKMVGGEVEEGTGEGIVRVTVCAGGEVGIGIDVDGEVDAQAATRSRNAESKQVRTRGILL